MMLAASLPAVYKCRSSIVICKKIFLGTMYTIDVITYKIILLTRLISNKFYEGGKLRGDETFTEQCSFHIETSQLIFTVG